MNWTRSETLALAQQSCTYCLGLGLRPGRGGSIPCNCVFRAIFRACYSQFRQLASDEGYLMRTHAYDAVYSTPARGSRMSCGIPKKRKTGNTTAEYIADFALIAKRALSADEYLLFKFHFLLGADWKLCCRRLRMDRGNFFHAVYRVEQKLGRAFRETRPYPLFPCDEYFHGNRRPESEPDRAIAAEIDAPPAALKFPLKASAA